MTRCRCFSHLPISIICHSLTVFHLCFLDVVDTMPAYVKVYIDHTAWEAPTGLVGEDRVIYFKLNVVY